MQKSLVRKVEVYKEPELMDVNPAQGIPYDKVIIRGKYLPKDRTQNEVWFVINPEVSVQAKTLAVTTSQDVVNHQVQVPSRSGLQSGFSGEVYMKPWGWGPPKRPIRCRSSSTRTRRPRS